MARAEPVQDQHGDNAALRAALSEYDIASIRALHRRLPASDVRHIPGGGGLPLLGHGVSLIVDTHKWLNERHEKYGKVFRLNVPALNEGGGGAVMLLGPDANQLVFQNEGQQFSNYLAWHKNFRGLFDDNLLQRDFRDHKTLRRTLQSAFRREAIEGHMELLNPHLRDGLKRWPTGTALKSMDHLKELFLTAGSSVFLGVQTGDKTADINRAFTEIVSGTLDLFRQKAIWFSPYARGVRAREYLTRFVVEKIPACRKAPTRDLLSHFSNLRDEHGDYFSDEEICNQLLFILFAAHDTTTSTISSVLYSIAAHPEWQVRMREEMQSIANDNVAFGDLDRMPSTSLVIKEALRMYPPLVMMPRHTLEGFEYEGQHIPPNTTVTVSALFSHYMPEYWADPNVFDPTRFSAERAEDKGHPFIYIPFGGGAHKCLGLHFAQVQSKIFLFHLLRNYKVTKGDDMTHYRYTNVPLTFPTDGLPLTFQPID